MSKFTLVLDSSQLSDNLDCPMFWKYKSIEKLAYPVEEEREVMNAGTLGHQMLDLYYTARASGIGFNDAFQAALAFNPDTDFRCKCGHIKKEHTLHIPQFGVGPCGCTRCKAPMCKKFDPVPFALSQDLRFAVVSRLRDYFFTYQQNDFIPNNPAAVEVGFSEPIYEDSENLFVLEGRIDLIGTIQGLPTIVDHKFQLRKKDLFQKAVQFRNYDLVCKGMTNMLTINYIRLAKAAGKDTLQRVPISFNAMERRWWHGELIRIYFQIKEQMAADHFPRNWEMCGGKYGYPCMYTPICHEVLEDVRELKKQQLFTIKKEQWKPW